MLCKDNEHLWRHVNESLTDFEMPMYDREVGMPCILKRTRMCPCMMLYAIDKMFHVLRGVGDNNVDAQCGVAYKILTLASLCCMEWRCCAKKCCNTLSDVYPLVDLTDVDNQECLTWAASFSMAKLWGSIALHVQWHPLLPSGPRGSRRSRDCCGWIGRGSPEPSQQLKC